MLGRATCPKTCGLKLFKRTWQIRNLSDWQVKYGSCGRLVCSNTNAGSAGVCNNNTSCTNYLGASYDCTKISFISDVIKNYNQGIIRTGTLDNFRKLCVGKRLCTDNNALVSAMA